MKKDEIYAEVKKNEYIRDGQHIVLGLSGGPDSVCLFNILLELKDEIDIAVYPVYVNHMIKGLLYLASYFIRMYLLNISECRIVSLYFIQCCIFII